MISTIILTHQEESDLPECLRSLAWCDDVHVVDSGSTDGTQKIAREAGAGVHVNPFNSFGQQRNWALAHCTLKHNWILFLDADERATPEFCEALQRSIENAPNEVAGFYCCWKLMLFGTWLRRCDSFPKWQFRLLRKGRADFTDFGHGQKEGRIDGRLEYLREPYLHFAFSKGWSAWLTRHNRYSSQEAAERAALPPRWQNIFSGNSSIRNPALKPLVSRIPGWPLLIFLYRYIARGGFFEGRAGFVYCVNMAIYEYLIRLKMDESRRSESLSS